MNDLSGIQTQHPGRISSLIMDQTQTLIDGVPTLDEPGFLQQNLERATILLRESNQHSGQLESQLQMLQLENDRLHLMVEQKKTQYALLEEKKATNELQMKRDIKQLLTQIVYLQQSQQPSYPEQESQKEYSET